MVFQKSPPASTMMVFCFSRQCVLDAGRVVRVVTFLRRLQPQPFMPASTLFSQYNMADPTAFGGSQMNPMYGMMNQGPFQGACSTHGSAQLCEAYRDNVMHTSAGMDSGMLNPYSGGMSPMPMNQMMMMNQPPGSPALGYQSGTLSRHRL